MPKSDAEEDALFELVAEAGADDLKEEDGVWEVYCEPGVFGGVRDSIDTLGKEFTAELTKIPNNTILLESKDAETLLKLLDALEDLDDVQKVVGNFEFKDSDLEAVV